MKKPYQKPTITALGLLRCVTKLSMGDPSGNYESCHIAKLP